MKKSTRRCPELESLEAKQRLSTVMAEAHRAAKVPASGPLRLSGSGPVTLDFTKSSLNSGITTLTGSAQLRSIGQASVKIVMLELLPPGVSYQE